MFQWISIFLKPAEQHWLGSATKFYTELASYFAAAAAVAASYFAIEKTMPSDVPRWIVHGISWTPPCLAILRSVIIHWGKPAPAPPLDPRFQLVPLTEVDRDGFERADGIHDEIFDWIQKSTEPVLYITGLSGAGKTSVINASVRPRLEEQEDVVLIALRGLDSIQARIQEKLTEPGVVWKDPQDSQNGLELLQRAGVKLKRDGKRLVVLIDQFEELIRWAENDPDRARELEFLRTAVSSRAEETILIFVLRDDWKADLAASGFPKLRQDENWKSVEPLYPGPASEFLRSHGVEDEGMAYNLVNRAIEVDDAAGKIRLITLNMVGIIYARFPDLAERHAASRGRGGRMFTDYIQRVLGAGATKLEGVSVLRTLVTRSGDRKPPQAEDDIENASNLDRRQVRRTVLDLRRQGLIQEAGSGWEVSHDFLANVLNGLFDSVLRSYVRVAARVALPSLVVLWLVAGILVPSVWYSKERQRWKTNFEQADGAYSEETGAVTFGSSALLTKDGLRWIVDEYPQVRSLNLTRVSAISGDSLQALVDLADLETLILAEWEHVTSEGLAHLSGLTGLQTLNLNGNRQLTDGGLAHLSGLTGLQTLNLSYVKLTDEGLVHLSGLTGLQTLDFTNCSQLTDEGLVHLSGLTSLQTLDFTNCSQLTDEGLAHLSGLLGLQTLNISWCNLKDEGLVHLSGLTGLQTLDLTGSRQLTGEGLAHLSGLTGLQTLDLSYCPTLTDEDLAHLSGLTGLQTLDLTFCRQLTAEGIRSLAKDLPNTTIRH